ncbi:hypothetical protein GGX14DRAFT_388118 [Mycena pura]|uniref:Uncharacterized protein n=1 Tax=Mycena pura TaxID=153505 RepID=A0AAD6YKS3_9AGAR|nr:hypothetical protein GGX14DRAFT_388118 [Mycena pura]
MTAVERRARSPKARAALRRPWQLAESRRQRHGGSVKYHRDSLSGLLPSLASLRVSSGFAAPHSDGGESPTDWKQRHGGSVKYHRDSPSWLPVLVAGSRPASLPHSDGGESPTDWKQRHGGSVKYHRDSVSGRLPSLASLRVHTQLSSQPYLDTDAALSSVGTASLPHSDGGESPTDWRQRHGGSVKYHRDSEYNTDHHYENAIEDHNSVAQLVILLVIIANVIVGLGTDPCNFLLSPLSGLQSRARSLKSRAALDMALHYPFPKGRSPEARAALEIERGAKVLRSSRPSLELLFLNAVPLHMSCFPLGTPLFIFIPRSLKAALRASEVRKYFFELESIANWLKVDITADGLTIMGLTITNSSVSAATGSLSTQEVANAAQFLLLEATALFRDRSHDFVTETPPSSPRSIWTFDDYPHLYASPIPSLSPSADPMPPLRRLSVDHGVLRYFFSSLVLLKSPHYPFPRGRSPEAPAAPETPVASLSSLPHSVGGESPTDLEAATRRLGEISSRLCERPPAFPRKPIQCWSQGFRLRCPHSDGGDSPTDWKQRHGGSVKYHRDSTSVLSLHTQLSSQPYLDICRGAQCWQGFAAPHSDGGESPTDWKQRHGGSVKYHRDSVSGLLPSLANVRLELLSFDLGNRRSLEARAALEIDRGAPSLEPEVTLTTLPLPRCIAVERRARSLKARAALRRLSVDHGNLRSPEARAALEIERGAPSLELLFLNLHMAFL